MSDASRPHEVTDIESDLGSSTTRVVLVVALGGAAGALARHLLTVAVPSAADRFPWTVLTLNVAGSLLLGVLLEAVDTWRAHSLLRPALGTGLLGGFTTFSTYAVGVAELAQAGRVTSAAGYLLLTLIGCTAGAAAGGTLVGAAAGTGRRG